MVIFNDSTLPSDILQKHRAWLLGQDSGCRAELRKADLCQMNMSGVNLSFAVLSGANMMMTNLQGADLSNTDLDEADLRGADLSGTDLSGASMRRANLLGAKLDNARLSQTDLEFACLKNASLKATDLYKANLDKANLSGANLEYSSLREASLRSVILTNARLLFADMKQARLDNADLRRADMLNACLTLAVLDGARLDDTLALMQCPDEGQFTAWKRAGKNGEYILKLLIPSSARRSSATSRICRADRAKVLAIERADGKECRVKSVQSMYSPDFIYAVGKTAKVKEFNQDRWTQCSDGIHFFITRLEAEAYLRAK